MKLEDQLISMTFYCYFFQFNHELQEVFVSIAWNKVVLMYFFNWMNNSFWRADIH